MYLHVLCLATNTTLVTPVASEPLGPTLSLSLPSGLSQIPEGWRTLEGEGSPDWSRGSEMGPCVCRGPVLQPRAGSLA